ncbi:glycine cleavage system aminomethyltransferase GcvT [candidate division KSB1 bacterium]|nr:MAG: glycine cleavage system aminomethyltransferase GcvT [candidate division KSB1 bacterium]
MGNTKKTALYEIHKKLGAKIVEFAGFYMPVFYTSIIEEHRKVRSSVGVFDVSHMGEIEIYGEKALEFTQKITVNDPEKLEVGQVQYSAMCYPDGGIVDDLLVYRFKDKFMLVVNAANTDKDYQWILDNKIDDVEIKNISDKITLLAIQGPKSRDTLQKLTSINLSEIKYYWFKEGKLADIDMIISRTGYTGELGFELYISPENSERLWNKIFEAGKEYDIAPVGLGARDTLRLEKKYALYGNDIDKTTNPLEAGLGWIVKLDKKDFIGKDALLKIKSNGIKRKLIGFITEGNTFPRKGYNIFKNNTIIGKVTSGTFSPSISKGIGLGYVDIAYSKIGEKIFIEIRKQKIKAEIVKTPFV